MAYSYYIYYRVAPERAKCEARGSSCLGRQRGTNVSGRLLQSGASRCSGWRSTTTCATTPSSSSSSNRPHAAEARRVPSGRRDARRNASKRKETGRALRGANAHAHAPPRVEMPNASDLFASGAHPRFPLIVAANRDEGTRGPPHAGSVLARSPGVYAGRDLEQGGTWLGVTRTGASPPSRTTGRRHREPGARSRGELTRGFLTGSEHPERVPPTRARRATTTTATA